MTTPNLKPRKHHAQKHLSPKSPMTSLSTKTKFFIQKICYKETASIDMTKNGFVKYATMMHPLQLLLKPLKELLAKILTPNPLQRKLEQSTKSHKQSLSRQRDKNSRIRGSKQPKRKPVKIKIENNIIVRQIPKDVPKKMVKHFPIPHQSIHFQN